MDKNRHFPKHEFIFFFKFLKIICIFKFGGILMIFCEYRGYMYGTQSSMNFTDTYLLFIQKPDNSLYFTLGGSITTFRYTTHCGTTKNCSQNATSVQMIFCSVSHDSLNRFFAFCVSRCFEKADFCTICQRKFMKYYFLVAYKKENCAKWEKYYKI